MKPKGDLEYYRNLGSEGMAHAIQKPWSDAQCGLYLMELGAMLGLMPGKGKLLDLGCGTGWTSHIFAKSGYDVTGTDFASEAIEAAKQNYGIDPTVKIRFQQSSFSELGMEGEFDCAVFFDSLHHADDEGLAVASAYKALKKGGILITSEPGVGHARRSKATIEEFGVIEKDMPPFKIIKAGKRARFTSYSIHPHASYLHIALYRAASSSMMGKVMRLPAIRTLFAAFNLAVYKYLSGIVVLRK